MREVVQGRGVARWGQLRTRQDGQERLADTSIACWPNGAFAGLSCRWLVSY